jgi:hypothetical protein
MWAGDFQGRPMNGIPWTEEAFYDGSGITLGHITVGVVALGLGVGAYFLLRK